MDSAGADSKWLTPDMTSLAVSAVGNPYLFTGRRYDLETRTAGHSGLYYYRARVYHPDLMRFCQPDPIGYADSMNLYAYCSNNPVNCLDSWGFCKAPGMRTIEEYRLSGGTFCGLCHGDSGCWGQLPEDVVAMRSLLDAAGMTALWMSGCIGPDNLSFGQDSVQAYDMSQTIGVAAGRRAFAKMQGIGQETYTQRWVRPGNRDAWTIFTYGTNNTERFIGKYHLTITALGNNTQHIQITNDTQFESLTGGLVPLVWRRPWPGGIMTETIEWTEPIPSTNP